MAARSAKARAGREASVDSLEQSSPERFGHLDRDQEGRLLASGRLPDRVPHPRSDEDRPDDDRSGHGAERTKAETARVKREIVTMKASEPARSPPAIRRFRSPQSFFSSPACSPQSRSPGAQEIADRSRATTRNFPAT